MSDLEANVIWVSSSSGSETSGEYATCAADSIDLELSDNDEICQLIAAFAIAEDQAAELAGTVGVEAPDNLPMLSTEQRATGDQTAYQIIGPTGVTTETVEW